MRLSLCAAAVLAVAAIAAPIAAPTGAQAAPISILFVGNSYTFGRVDPVMSYNAANVTDLTAAMAVALPSGSNPYEPHPWGGVPGIFKMLTSQAGLDYDVSISARNAASLRGHFLNTNPAGWDLRGNIASRAWDKVVLQDLSDEPLPLGKTANASPGYFSAYANKIEDFIHSQTASLTYTESSLFAQTVAGNTNAARASGCIAATGASQASCNLSRTVPGNPNARAATDVYLYETWARPDLVTGAVTSVTDSITGAVTRTTTPGPGAYPSLEAMTADLRANYFGLAASNPDFKGVVPVGDAFLAAVTSGLATRDPYAANALTDGLIDLWWDDALHASKWGSYLSGLTMFGKITGLDPQSLGSRERAASDLGIGMADAYALQQVAAAQLGFALRAEPVPEPASLGAFALGLALLARRRRA